VVAKPPLVRAGQLRSGTRDDAPATDADVQVDAALAQVLYSLFDRSHDVRLITIVPLWLCGQAFSLKASFLALRVIMIDPFELFSLLLISFIAYPVSVDAASVNAFNWIFRKGSFS